MTSRHCSSSPFATASHAAIFPPSIENIGTGLRLMAERHFSRCSVTPRNVRDVIKRELSSMQKGKIEEREEDDGSMRSLNQFCSEVAKRFNLQNLNPYNTGIMFSINETEERSREPPQQYLSRQPNSRLQSDVFPSTTSYHHSQQYTPPRQNPPHMYRPHPSMPLQQNLHITSSFASPQHRHMDRRTPPMYPSDIYPPQPIYLNESSFIRESTGWSCRHCSSLPLSFRAPNSFYPNITPPPPWYTEYHLQRCTGTRFYQQPIEHSGHDPDALSLESALDYLSSNSNHDSHLVLDEDKSLLSDYFFYLMKQLQLCCFSESDRKIRGGKRDNVKLGFSGFECRHCAKFNPSTSRKFFWSNVDRLANSYAEIVTHVLNCKSCPEKIKKSLHVLKVNHPNQISQLPRGSQKVFFRRMWRRMHADSITEHEEDAIQDDSTFTTISTTTTIPKPPISSTFLSVPEDKDWLSDIDCIMRRNLEVFCASHGDVIAAQAYCNVPIHIGQVGIRCRHCAASSDGAKSNAMCFPDSIDGIYDAVGELHKSHIESCSNIPADVSKELASMKTSTSLSSVSKRYYILAAKTLGIIDTPQGMRMSRGKIFIPTTVDVTSKSSQDKVDNSSSTKKSNEEDKEELCRKRKASSLPKNNEHCKKQSTL